MFHYQVTMRANDRRLIMRRSAWEKLRLEELSHRPHEGMCSRAFDFSFEAPAKRSQHVNATYRNIVGRNMLCSFGHHVAMCCDMLGVVGSSLKMVKFGPTTPNTSQHVATGWPNARNMLRPTMLRSFGRGLTASSQGCLPFVRINRLGRALNNGKGFSKISKPTERNGAYHLHFDFP